MADESNAKKICVPSGSSEEGGVPASPPRFVSFEELMAAAKGMTQMSLTHEIVHNKDFKVHKQEPKSGLEKLVKETMHKAFWDMLDSELKQDPPVYVQALSLIEEVKENLMDLLLPQHTRLRQRIDEVLDMDLIRQQAEKGILHEQYLEYAQFVVSIMAKLCAPIRDEKIAELTQMKEVVPLFQGILDTIATMKVDMANFTIDVMRPTILANSVAYEKKKFADWIKVNPDGLDFTREWLSKHLDVAGDDSQDVSKRIDKVVNNAYIDLINWDPSVRLPETLTMDSKRITTNTAEFLRLTRAGTVLLIVFSHAGPNLTSVASWKQTVKDHVLTLITTTSALDLSAVAVKMVADITDAAAKYNVTGHSVVALEEAIKSVGEPNHKIFDLLSTRIREFLLAVITSRTAERLRIPPGLSILQEETTELAGNFLRLVSYNREVFEEHYVKIITELLQKKHSVSSASDKS